LATNIRKQTTANNVRQKYVEIKGPARKLQQLVKEVRLNSDSLSIVVDTALLEGVSEHAVSYLNRA